MTSKNIIFALFCFIFGYAPFLNALEEELPPTRQSQTRTQPPITFEEVKTFLRTCPRPYVSRQDLISFSSSGELFYFLNPLSSALEVYRTDSLTMISSVPLLKDMAFSSGKWVEGSHHIICEIGTLKATGSLMGDPVEITNKRVFFINYRTNESEILIPPGGDTITLSLENIQIHGDPPKDGTFFLMLSPKQEESEPTAPSSFQLLRYTATKLQDPEVLWDVHDDSLDPDGDFHINPKDLNTFYFNEFNKFFVFSRPSSDAPFVKQTLYAAVRFPDQIIFNINRGDLIIFDRTELTGSPFWTVCARPLEDSSPFKPLLPADISEGLPGDILDWKLLEGPDGDTIHVYRTHAAFNRCHMWTSSPSLSSSPPYRALKTILEEFSLSKTVHLMDLTRNPHTNFFHVIVEENMETIERSMLLYKIHGNGEVERHSFPARGMPLQSFFSNKLLPQEAFEIQTSLGPLSGYVVRPKNWKTAERLPTIFHFHGGPSSVRFRGSLDLAGQVLASYGYQVISLNPRGSAPGFGKQTPQDLLYDQVFQHLLYGIEHCKVSMKVGPYATMGASFGAYAALQAATHCPAIGFNGIYDLPSWIDTLRKAETSPDNPYKYSSTDITQGLLGKEGTPHPLPEEDMFYLRRISVDAKKIGHPVLLIATQDDEKCPFTQTTNLAQQLSKADLRLYERGGHSPSDINFWEPVFRDVIGFLTHYLR